MSKRWIGVGVSVALALVGAFLIVRYVQSADERALEGEETVEVLVLTEPIVKGTAAEDLADSVELKLVPSKLQTPGSVGDLSVLAGTYASTDLVAGEQLLTSRFVTADNFLSLEKYPLPDGMLEVTLSLSPERALGGALLPGEAVSVIASFAPFSVSGTQDEIDLQPTPSVEEEDGALEETFDPSPGVAAEVNTPSTTHLIIHSAIITNVQVERLPTASDAQSAEQSGVALAPTGNLLVSLAMDPNEVERTVFTAEFGNVWLALESEGAVNGVTEIQTRATVYEDQSGSLDQASIK